jgi:hypothetical protein
MEGTAWRFNRYAERAQLSPSNAEGLPQALEAGVDAGPRS